MNNIWNFTEEDIKIKAFQIYQQRKLRHENLGDDPKFADEKENYFRARYFLEAIDLCHRG